MLFEYVFDSILLKPCLLQPCLHVAGGGDPEPAARKHRAAPGQEEEAAAGDEGREEGVGHQRLRLGRDREARAGQPETGDGGEEAPGEAAVRHGAVAAGRGAGRDEAQGVYIYIYIYIYI